MWVDVCRSLRVDVDEHLSYELPRFHVITLGAWREEGGSILVGKIVPETSALTDSLAVEIVASTVCSPPMLQLSLFTPPSLQAFSPLLQLLRSIHTARELEYRRTGYDR